MNIMTFTLEKLERLETELTQIQNQLIKFNGSTPEDLWLEDLDEFEHTYRDLFYGKHEKDSNNVVVEYKSTIQKNPIAMPLSEHRTVSLQSATVSNGVNSMSVTDLSKATGSSGKANEP
jgi:hypothetical protein